MTIFTEPLDERIEDALFAQLQSEGLACMPNIIPPELLTACQDYTGHLIKERGERYFSLIQPWMNSDAGAFASIATDQSFISLMSNLSRRGHSDEATRGSKLYNLLRVIAGDSADAEAFKCHYDATVLTVLMPLIIPEGAPDKSGDLVALPNSRPFRRSSIVNVMEKITIQNPLGRAIFKARYGSGQRNVVKLKPGNLYFFWGYRTLHANLPAAPGEKRATLLFHFGDPHPHSELTKGILKLKWLREKMRGNTPVMGTE